jgi:Gnt-I system high-affinity gluconate transporter
MGFGAMLGKMLADCGGAHIATTLIAKFGKQHIQWAVVLTGFTVGFALFYEVGFVLMLPLVFTIAASAGIPLLYIGVPMAAALSVTHGSCLRTRARRRLPLFSMPTWARPCCSVRFWRSRRLSSRARFMRAS